MMHADCLLAAWDGDEASCPHCHEPVASLGRGRHRLVLRDGLGRRPRRHDQLFAYGLGDRARLRGKTPSTTNATGRRAVVGEVFVYCPNRRCERGMHISRPSA
jgi:hypothetical protein